LAGETAVYGLADAVGRGLSFFLFPIFTRILTPTQYGAIEVIGTVTYLLSAVLMLGLDSATTRLYYAPEYKERKGTVLGTALMFSVLVYIGGVTAVLVVHRWVNRMVLGTALYQTALMLALIAIPFTLLTNFHLNTLRRLLRPWWFAGLSMLSLMLTISLNVTFVWRLRWGVQGTYSATLIASGVTAMVGMWWTRRFYRWEWDRSLLTSLLRFGIPLVPASLCLWGLALLDRLFLVRFASLAEVGLYSTANRLSSALAFGVAAFQMAWGPFAYSISGREDARLVYSRTLSYYVALGGLGVLGLSLFAPEALWVLTPVEYHGAALAVGPLAVGVLAYGAYTLVAIGVNLANRTGQVSITLAGATALNLVLCILLIPRFGMMGAAFATAVGWVAAASFLCVASQRVFWIPYDWGLVGRLVLLLLGCLAAGVLVIRGGEPTWSHLAVKTGIVGVYLLGMKFWGLVPERSAWWPAPRQQAPET
jgi:O-antigen/teichoic acid export membrane protein